MSELPGGTWSLTARDTILTSTILYAELQTKNGSWHPTWTWIWKGCTYTNIDGNFTIDKAPVPGGSWIKTAKNPQVLGDILTAELQKRDQTWVTASTKLIPGVELRNVNGRFVLVYPKGIKLTDEVKEAEGGKDLNKMI